MTRTEAERIAALEAKFDSFALELNLIKTDVRQLLIRDIERAVVSRYVGRITKAIPWAALVTAVGAWFVK